MIAEILPLRRFTRGRGIFDYIIPSDLEDKTAVGQIVMVPFIRSNIPGLVVKIKKTTHQQKEKMKQIYRLVSDIPPLPVSLIKQGLWLGKWSLVSPAAAFQMIIPSFPKRPATVSKADKLPLPLKISIPEADTVRSLLRCISKSANGLTPVLAEISSKKTQLAFLVKCAEYFIKKQKKAIIVFPTIYECNTLLSHLPSKARQSTAVMTSRLSRSESYQAWLEVAQNKKNLVIGTKLALFTPLSSLDQIIIAEEENRNHKQEDQNPRFHVRSAALNLAKIAKASLLFTTFAPSLEAYYNLGQKKWRKIPDSHGHAQKISVVNRQEEFDKKNYSPLSESLRESIKDCLKKEQKVFLFLNQRGVASNLACVSCGQVAQCPACSLAYTVDEKNQLTCHHCQRKKSIPDRCSNCQGITWKQSGIGTQRIVSEIRKIHPKISLARLDSDVKEHDLTGQIFVGTEKALPYLSQIKPNLIGVISADTLLHVPDFRAAERTYQLLYNLIAELPWSGAMIIQTFSPQLALFQAITKNAPDLFYGPELASRTALRYPPGVQLIKLILKTKEKRNLDSEAHRLAAVLKKESVKNVEIIGPTEPYQQSKNQASRLILLKVPLDLPAADIDSLLNLVPDQWMVDREPFSII